jgi:hypothetical protein
MSDRKFSVKAALDNGTLLGSILPAGSVSGTEHCQFSEKIWFYLHGYLFVPIWLSHAGSSWFLPVLACPSCQVLQVFFAGLSCWSFLPVFLADLLTNLSGLTGLNS